MVMDLPQMLRDSHINMNVKPFTLKALFLLFPTLKVRKSLPFDALLVH